MEEGEVGVDGVAEPRPAADPVEEGEGGAGVEGVGPEEVGDVAGGEGRGETPEIGVAEPVGAGEDREKLGGGVGGF